MVNVTIYKGDVILKDVIKDEYSFIMLPKIEYLIASPLSGKYTTKVIDASMCNDTEFIRKAIERSIYPLVIIFPDGKLPFKKTEFKTKNKVEIIDGVLKEKANLFKLIEVVLSSEDRSFVYESLKANKDLHHVLFLYLYDNALQSLQDNIGILSFIDMVALHKDTNRFCELLAFSFQPIHRKMFLKYQRPKKDE